MKVLVIGGIAGGPSFATRLRRINEDAEIIILERGAAISVASCALPYYLGGLIKNRSAVIERTPEILKQKNNIDVRLFNEVTKINSDAKTVEVHDLQKDETYTENYDKLIIATGASPTVPEIPGIHDADNAFVLRAVTDADKIKSFLDTKHPKHVTVLGANQSVSKYPRHSLKTTWMLPSSNNQATWLLHLILRLPTLLAKSSKSKVSMSSSTRA